MRAVNVTLARLAAVTAAALAWMSGLPGPARAQRAAARPNVLLITLDTTRADRIGAYGYKQAQTPNLDRLAAEGIRFADATTQSPVTAPAHVALLTGRHPTRLGVKDNASTPLPDSALTLAEALKGAGYRTAAFIGAFVLDRQYGFAQGFDLFDATFEGFRPETKQQLQRRADEVVAPAREWLANAPSGAPFFAWVHFYDAHTPYDAPPPVGRVFANRPYDGEIAYMDAAVGKLLDTLRTSGTLDRTIVAAVGDHGEALGEHGEEDHGIFLYEGVLHVPWIVRLPRAERAGTVIAEQVRSIDVTPTLLDLTGSRHDRAAFDGESLVQVLHGKARRDPPPSFADAHYPELHFGWSKLRSWRVGEWKYIDAPRPELYDLRSDRAEARNVIAERGNVAARMTAELEATWRDFGSQADTQPPQPDPATLARLRSLGYVGIAAPRPKGSSAPDPKDKIAELKVFRSHLSRAIDDLSAGRTDAAIQRLKRAAAINERAYDLHILLGDAWMQKRQYENAIGEYDAAALLNPSIAAPHVLAAQVYMARRRVDQALERLATAERIEPGSADVASVRGRIYDRTGRTREAFADFQRAVAANPSDLSTRGQLVNTAMKLGDLAAAESHARVLLEREYQLPLTHLILGQIAEARGNRDVAAAEYRRALKLDPNLQQARAALARVTGR